MSRSSWAPSIQRRITKTFEPEDFRLRPESGIVYVPAGRVRERLNKIFGAGNVGVALGEPQEKGADVVMKVSLLINGMLVAEAYGEGRYIQSNSQMSWGDVLETCKTNGMMRCAKSIGVAEDCWNDQFQYDFRLKHGVYVQTAKGRQWRSLYQPPLETERGIMPDSPNRDRYVAPTVVQRNASRPKSTAKPADVEGAKRVRQETRMVAVSDEPISTAALGQLISAAKQHKRTDVELKGWLRNQWGYTTKKQILKSQYQAVLEWIRAPYDADPPDNVDTLTGEVVE